VWGHEWRGQARVQQRTCCSCSCTTQHCACSVLASVSATASWRSNTSAWMTSALAEAQSSVTTCVHVHARTHQPRFKERIGVSLLQGKASQTFSVFFLLRPRTQVQSMHTQKAQHTSACTFLVGGKSACGALTSSTLLPASRMERMSRHSTSTCCVTRTWSMPARTAARPRHTLTLAANGSEGLCGGGRGEGAGCRVGRGLKVGSPAKCYPTKHWSASLCEAQPRAHKSLLGQAHALQAKVHSAACAPVAPTVDTRLHAHALLFISCAQAIPSSDACVQPRTNLEQAQGLQHIVHCLHLL